VRVVLTILGVLMILMGGIWTLQGFNILPGSFMTGNLRWAFNGVVLAAVGIGLIVWARRQSTS
jgi:hypothetical protein